MNSKRSFLGNRPHVPETSLQWSRYPSEGAFLDVLVPDEAAKVMRGLYNGVVPREKVARETIRLGKTLGFKVARTTDRKYGYDALCWMDNTGVAVYSGLPQQKFTQLALKFAAERRNLQDVQEPARLPEIDEVPATETLGSDQNETLQGDDPTELSNVTEADILNYEQELTAFDYVQFVFGLRANGQERDWNLTRQPLIKPEA